jgi:hypothetical protein
VVVSSTFLSVIFQKELIVASFSCFIETTKELPLDMDIGYHSSLQPIGLSELMIAHHHFLDGQISIARQNHDKATFTSFFFRDSVMLITGDSYL